MKVYTCAQMKKIEENAHNSGMSYLDMMENAGKACFEKINKLVIKDSKPKVCVLCGKGKNGGDGFVIARHMRYAGISVSVVLIEGAPKADEAAEMLRRADGVEVIDIFKDSNEAINRIMYCDVVVDCIFGIGFKGKMNGLTAELSQNINAMKKLVVAVDIPSGLEGDAGTVNSVVLKADITLAVSCLKPVHVLKPSSGCCGKVYTVDIGFSKECYTDNVSPAFECADIKYVKERLIKREDESNKGTYGKLLCVCGSRNMQGAAVLCTNAAVKSGAGIVVSAFPDKAYAAIAPKITEALMLPLKDDKAGYVTFDAEDNILKTIKMCSAAAVGCGMGNSESTKRIVTSIIKSAKCPLIIDADGINAVSSNINILKSAKVPVILTPHPGEMARLTGKSVREIQNNRIETAREFAVNNNVTVILKGNNSVIAFENGTVFINPTGNAGMAKGGSGDVLTGIIGAFLAQGINAHDAAVCAVYIHGLCGDETAKKYSKTGMTPSMMINHLPTLFSKFE